MKLMKKFDRAASLRPSLTAIAAGALCTSLAHAAPAAPAAPADEVAVAGTPVLQDTTPAGAVATVEISTRKTRSAKSRR